MGVALGGGLVAEGQGPVKQELGGGDRTGDRTFHPAPHPPVCFFRFYDSFGPVEIERTLRRPNHTDMKVP